jgi:LPXTG-motif cell wall-anchored protein
MRTSRFAVVTALVVALGAALAAPASAQGDAPAGNNGTIKVDDVLLDDGNENVAHPGCGFVVDFFGYDVGTRTATLTFEGQEPTAGGELRAETITFDVATRDSGNQLNESHVVDLTEALAGIAPHPKQGWHVKLTVHVDGAQGADVKHKVFWVSQCESPVLVASQAAVDFQYAAAVSAAGVQAGQDAEAAAAAAAAAAAPAPVAPAAAELPATGSTTSLLALIALGLLACGAIATVTGRRLQAI